MSRTAAARLLVAGLLALTALKLWWCGRFELSPDEAYYRLWSQRLDWAYFSKGPGIALAIRFATWLGGDAERGVRWLSPLLGLATSAMLWLLVRDAFSRAAATLTVVVLQAVPLFTVGTLLMTIDPLSIACWVLALLCGQRALRGRGDAWWAAAGAAAGVGFACKYTNALALAGLLLAAAASATRGRWWLSLASFAPFTLPPLAWNAAHGWPTAAHLLERGGLDRGGMERAGLEGAEPWLQPRETLELVAVHFGTWSPIVFALVLASLPAAIRAARRRDGGERFLLLASAPVLVLYAALGLHEAGEANWTAPGILGLLPIAVEHWRARLRPRAGALVLALALVPAAALSLAIADSNLLRAAGIPLPARSDPSTRLRGWQDTAVAMRELGADREHLPLVAHHYGLASELAYYGGFPVKLLRADRPRNQFWFWDDRSMSIGDGPFVYASERGDPPDPAAAACVPLGERRIDGPGGTLRVLRAWSCVPRRESLGSEP